MPLECDLSFVVTTRNDDHGGNLLRRFQIFANALLEQANRHSLSAELIVVEWNPPPGPRLHDVLKLRGKSDLFAIRFIEVPPEAHGMVRNSDVIPLFQMIAKNVGIRRARGEFILATNPDLLFSDALISFLASGKLHHDFMYRIDRHDVPAELPENVSLDKQLGWCAANVLRIHRRRGSFSSKRQLLSRLEKLNPIVWVIALMDAYKRLRGQLPPWPVIWQRLRRPSLSVIKESLTKLLAAFYASRRLMGRALRGASRYLDPLPKVHTNACGDFTLMSRQRWFMLRGYPELPLWSMHIDSLLCYMAVASGVRERTLRPPARMFHVEHHNSWVVMTPDERLRTFSMKPWIDIGLINQIWDSMYRSRRAIEFNDKMWGLAEWCLDEIVMISGEKRFLKKGQMALGLTRVG